MFISEAAREAGVNVQTLRYYERRGLLPAPPRGGSGYREFPADAVQVVRFIKRAQELGFTLDEVEELIELRGVKRSERQRVRAVAERRMGRHRLQAGTADRDAHSAGDAGGLLPARARRRVPDYRGAES